jgi:hypothetical protein
MVGLLFTTADASEVPNWWSMPSNNPGFLSAVEIASQTACSIGFRRSTAATTANEGLQKVRARQAEAGIRQIDIARALGKPQAFVSYYESGAWLDLLELRQVCNALGVTLTDFVRKFEKRLQ